MPIKKPLCNYDGEIRELQSGDSLPSCSNGGGVYGQVQVDFGDNGSQPESILILVADGGVSLTSRIFAQVVSPSIGRDLDEMELEQFSCAVGEIIDSTSFQVLVTCTSGGAHGIYLVNYWRN